MPLPAPPTASVNRYESCVNSSSTTAASSGNTKIDGRRTRSGIACAYIAKSKRCRPRTSLEASSFERVAARAVCIGGNSCDDLTDRCLDALVVAIEDLDDFVMGDGWHTLEADVVVGDERNVRIAHLELAREVGLGVLRHVDDLPPLALEPL